MENDIRTKIERFKIKAEDFLNNNIKAFIVDINDTWYSCDIILVGEISLVVRNFEGNLIGKDQQLFWSDIVRFEEWRK
jgi:hypothetical protein